MKAKHIILLVGFLLSLQQFYAQVSVTNLRCEMLVDPLGIDIKQPRLSWQLKSDQRNVQQSAYEIIVSSSKEKLSKHDGDVWNSGKINSSQSIHIKYAGKVLQSGKEYFWKVKSFTNKGETVWSESAYWSMGLLNKSDWKAKWIGYDKASPWDSITQWSRLSARYLRKEFQNTAVVKRATVYISGLGLYELYINGNKTGDQVLAPNPTDYRKSFFYNTHDVTAQIKTGSNAIATVLGNGRFFTMRQNYKPQKHNTFGYPKLLLQLEIEYTDGTKKIIVSDETWRLNVDGPIRTNNEYDGEEYDATKEFPGWSNAGFNDSKWIKPELVSSPPGKMVAQMAEPMKVMKTIAPVSVKSVNNGKYILDMGQNFAGWLQIKVQGKRGQKVQLRFAESLKADGELFTANLRDAKVTDVYTLKGEGVETWQPSFVYHGFRYVEVTGFPGTPTINDFEGKLIYDALETTGSFTTSSPVINSIYKNAWWGIASNYKGMPVDCPQRNERQPWLGDRVMGAMGETYLFDNAKLYAKWMQDIEESQTVEGAIPDVAPAFWNYYSDDVTWPAAFITISNHLYNQFGDITPIQKHYASMKKWMEYMKSKYMTNYIVTRDKYGDWCMPPESPTLIHAKDPSRLTDGKLIATAYYYKLLSYLQRFAGLLDKKDDAKEFGLLMNKIKVAFNKSFYSEKNKQYSNNTVTANLLPLYFGLVPDSLKAAIFEKIRQKIIVDNNGHTSTGLIGSQWVMRTLSDYGNTDLAYKLTTNTTYPSWGYMVANGATTIWELWNGNTADPGMNSQNHVMLLGDLLTWYYENLAGIRSDKTEVAFKKIIMKPNLPVGLDFVNASYNSMHGLIKSEWSVRTLSEKKNVAQIEWNISVPANSSAAVYIPAKSLTDVIESGVDLSKAEGVQSVKFENGLAIVQVGSGDYKFVSKIK
jgi:alpha-L-rhamnosidase